METGALPASARNAQARSGAPPPGPPPPRPYAVRAMPLPQMWPQLFQHEAGYLTRVKWKSLNSFPVMIAPAR